MISTTMIVVIMLTYPNPNRFAPRCRSYWSNCLNSDLTQAAIDGEIENPFTRANVCVKIRSAGEGF